MNLLTKGASVTEKVNVISPAYFARFRCKCGDCRSVCCHGWRITLSEEEYFRLARLECPPALRTALDQAFERFPGADEERFAYIAPNGAGNCRLLDADGWCSLQRACGEGVQPAVCRLYPRSIKPGDPVEASCSGSCERTVELLMTDEAFSITETALETRAAVPPYRPEEARTAALRQRCLALWLGAGAWEERLAAIAGALGLSEDGLVPLEAACALLARLSGASVSLRDVGAAAARRFSGAPGAAAEAAARLTARLPAWERYFTNVMANHLFFVQFPAVGGAIAPPDAYAGLAAACAVVRLCVLGAAADARDGEEARIRFADAAAAALRYVEHTDFYTNIPPVWRHLTEGTC